MVKRALLTCCLGILAIPVFHQAEAADVHLLSGTVLSGVVISRPESTSSRYVLTVSVPEQRLLYQFYAAEVDVIESATSGHAILNDAVALRSGPSEDSGIVQRFGPGMELKTGEEKGGWVQVTPLAQGLMESEGWVSQDSLVQSFNMTAWVAREGSQTETSPPEEIPAPQGDPASEPPTEDPGGSE